MLIIEFFSQPFWYRMGLTLTHFLWQGLVVAILAGTVVRLSRLKHGNTRYAAYLLAFIVMVACPIVTFMAIDASVIPITKPSVAEEESHAPFGAISYPLLSADDTRLETEITVPKVRAPGTIQGSIPTRQKFYSYLEASLPWAIACWMIGVIVLSVRLLFGFVGVCRWRRHLKPLPDDLGRRVASLSERLGMRNFSSVLISPYALQAMAVGYLRPLVLLPAAMVTQMQPEMLEAVIAHELAHIRRFDLWVNLAQRVVETLLFYHPAVWWLSNRLRSERELCCDELAVKATGERLTYASALESAGRARLLAKQPALAAGLGQDKKSTLSRVRHVLGLPPASQNSRFWLAGLVTVLVLAALATPTAFVLAARAQQKDPARTLHQAAAHGDINTVKSLIAEGADVNAKDGEDRTALHYAALKNHLTIAQLLIAKGADVDARDKQDFTPLYLSCTPHTGDALMAELLINKGANVNAKDARGNTPLHHAAKRSNHGYHDVIRRLTAGGADLNARNSEGQTPLHLAAAGRRDRDGHTVLLLNKLGADVNAKDNAGNTPLHVAVRQAREWAIADLLAKDAEVNTTNAVGEIPLHIVAGYVRYRADEEPRSPETLRQIVQWLISWYTNVNAADCNESTPLHAAALQGHTSIAETLVANGANLNAKDKHEHTPAYVALRASYTEVVDLLIDKGANVSSIHFVAYTGDLPRLKNLLETGASIDKKDEAGFSPLHAAAAGGHKSMVEYLISKGADEKAEARPGWTALSYAAAGNHMEVVELLRAKGVFAGKGASELLPIVAGRGYADAAKALIELGAKINIGERTALHEATEAGRKEMVELLISKGADVNAGRWTPLHITTDTGRADIARCLIAAGANLDAGEWTPLMEAAYYHKNMVELLISEGADINKGAWADINKGGWTALHSAVDNNRLDIAELLLASGANPNIRGGEPAGLNALHLAAWYRPHFVDLFIAKGADVNSRDGNGWTPLHFGIRWEECRDAVDTFIAKGADVNARTNRGETTLHLSATDGNKSQVQFALDKGVEINAKDELGWTALHRAVVFVHPDIAKLLIAEGADVNIKDNDGKTALDLAKKKGLKEVVELLLKHGAKE